jgi:hypothetical protein
MEDPFTHVAGVVNSVSTQRFVGNNLAVFAAPVPEPSSLILIAGGAMFAVLRRTRAARTRRN